MTLCVWLRVSYLTCSIVYKLNGIDVLDGDLQSFVQHVIEGADVMVSQGFKS